jgi:hypothetical protein
VVWRQGLTGPLGIVQVGADLAAVDSLALIKFAAFISINLAVVNALPIPVSLLLCSFLGLGRVSTGASLSSGALASCCSGERPYLALRGRG